MMEEFLKSVCEAHGLTALTVSFIPQNHEPFTAYPHRGNNCGGASGSTVGAALTAGLDDLNRRFPVASPSLSASQKEHA